MHTTLLIARLLLAAVFLVAGLTKLADLRGSREAVAGFGVPERLAAPVGTLLPLGELTVAGALLPSGSARWGAIGAFALLALFVAAISRSMIRGEAPDCHCFGQLHSEPAGWRTLARNGLLAAVAGFVVAAGWGSAGPSAVAWVGRMSGTGTVALVGGLALLALASGSASTTPGWPPRRPRPPPTSVCRSAARPRPSASRASTARPSPSTRSSRASAR
jgi:hypothetical protein